MRSQGRKRNEEKMRGEFEKWKKNDETRRWREDEDGRILERKKDEDGRILERKKDEDGRILERKKDEDGRI